MDGETVIVDVNEEEEVEEETASSPSLVEGEEGSSSVVVVLSDSQFNSLSESLYNINVSNSAVVVCLLFSLLVRFISRFFGR